MVGHTSLEEIDKITREFRESVIQPDGSQRLTSDHMNYMQRANFDIPNLDYDVLCEIPRFLVRTTVFPRGNRYGNADKPHFLTWMAEICHYGRWSSERPAPPPAQVSHEDQSEEIASLTKPMSAPFTPPGADAFKLPVLPRYLRTAFISINSPASSHIPLHFLHMSIVTNVSG